MIFNPIYPESNATHKSLLALHAFPPFYPKTTDNRAEAAGLIREIKKALLSDFAQDMSEVSSAIKNQSLSYNGTGVAEEVINKWLPRATAWSTQSANLAGGGEAYLNGLVWNVEATNDFSDVLLGFDGDFQTAIPTTYGGMFYLDVFCNLRANNTGGLLARLRTSEGGGVVAAAMTREFVSLATGVWLHMRLGPMTTEGFLGTTGSIYTLTLTAVGIDKNLDGIYVVFQGL